MNAPAVMNFSRSLGRKRQRGFTLVEMLVVIAIVLVLGAIAVPAVFGTTSAGRMNQNLLQLSGLIEDARQYALAQNTYVWVALAPGTDANGLKTLSVAILASKDGTDPASPQPWTSFSYGQVPSDKIGLVNKISTLRQISLADAGTLQVPTLPATPSPISGTANSVANFGTGFFTLQLPATTGQQSFTLALQFTPTGEARNSTSPVDVVDLDIQSQKGNTAVLDPNNFAVIRVNGLTGEPVIYRP